MRLADALTDRRWCQRAPVMVVALMAVGAIVAGCGGGGSSPGVANVTGSRTSTSGTHSSSSAGGDGGTALGGGGAAAAPGAHSNFAIRTANPQEALRFSQCMRANGVPNFPDPNGQGVIQGSGIDPSSPQFATAQKACAKYMGAGKPPSAAQTAQAEAAALAFSKCMRSHGEPDFPDPQFGSGGAIRISIRANGPGAGDLEPTSPIFQKAQRSCQSLIPGRAGAKL